MRECSSFSDAEAKDNVEHRAMDDNGLATFGGTVAFIALAAIGVMIFGAVTQFVLGLFGIAVTFGQACGIGFVLGLIFGALGK